jgi:hypothetical protein
VITVGDDATREASRNKGVAVGGTEDETACNAAKGMAIGDTTEAFTAAAVTR